MVDDALVLTDLVFKRLLKTPHPSFELAFHLFDVVELITCIDPVKIGELSIPGFLHMATLEEESTTLTYAAHVLEVVTGSMAPLTGTLPAGDARPSYASSERSPSSSDSASAASPFSTLPSPVLARHRSSPPAQRLPVQHSAPSFRRTSCSCAPKPGRRCGFASNPSVDSLKTPRPVMSRRQPKRACCVTTRPGLSPSVKPAPGPAP